MTSVLSTVNQVFTCDSIFLFLFFFLFFFGGGEDMALKVDFSLMSSNMKSDPFLGHGGLWHPSLMATPSVYISPPTPAAASMTADNCHDRYPLQQTDLCL